MMIKTVPEDFIVKEIFSKKPTGTGQYTWVKLKKRNRHLIEALKEISNKLGVSITRFGYAGMKDKSAITEQMVSVWNVSMEDLKKISIKDVELSDFVSSGDRINIGDLDGNSFIITVRDIDNKKERLEDLLGDFCKIAEKDGILNIFGPQRFGSFRGNNHLIGKEIKKET
jgi:tRNA pseudouridine13 synthase